MNVAQKNNGVHHKDTGVKLKKQISWPDLKQFEHQNN